MAGGRQNWGRRLLWFAALWCLGVAAVTLLAFLLKLVVP